MSPAQASCGDSLIITSSGFALNSTTTNASPSSNWSPSQSASLYKIDGWGVPYFSVNSSGNISVRPHGIKTLPHQEIDLMEVVKKVLEQKTSGGLGLQLPIIVRFPDVLKNRLECLQSAFDIAIESQDYRSHYQGVYPVKCNQDRFIVEDIVEDIVEFGSKFRFGLEAGSKPELLLAMSSLCKGSPDAFLICNGYKDAEYISLALVARRLELNTVIVLEQEEELDLVIDISRELGVRPVIGLRAKLRTKHSGHFGATSGEKGKFGLTTMQILRVAKKLEQAEMLDCLQLLHFHIGSQIPSTSLLSDGVGEAANIYCELVRLGVGMQFIDVGGGLGIDYDGSGLINSEVSINYGLEEYAETVVHAIRSACDRKSVKHPVICSESGRALVSHHSILIFEAVGATVSETPALSPIATDYQYFVEGLSEDAREDYRNMISSAMSGEYEMFILYSDKLKHRCVEQFKEGVKDLEYLAAMDHICESVAKALGRTDSVRTYHVNLSIFTSMPDFWAIDQQFPIIPIHRLDQRPGVKGILSDLTCDSDGKVDKFICGESSLLLHELGDEDENGVAGGYYLGMFLGGAYQEALGGFHNLFGGPSVVRVLQKDGPNSFAVTQTSPGLTCMEVLRVMQHEPELMFEALKHRIEERRHRDEDNADCAAMVSGLDRSFHNMPYLITTSGSPRMTTAPNTACPLHNCDNDDNKNDGLAVVSGDNEHWTYCCA